MCTQVQPTLILLVP